MSQSHDAPDKARALALAYASGIQNKRQDEVLAPRKNFQPFTFPVYRMKR